MNDSVELAHHLFFFLKQSGFDMSESVSDSNDSFIKAVIMHFTCVAM